MSESEREPTTAYLVAELRGPRCQCGRRKNAKQTFCRDCYYKLPPKLRANLYARLGQRYAEARQAALDYLTNETP